MPKDNDKFADHRAHTRHKCRCYATLCSTHETWPAHLLNISDAGALVAILSHHSLSNEDRIDLEIELEDGSLTLKGSIAHLKQHYLGLKYDDLSQEDHDRLYQALKSSGLYTR